MREEIVTWLFFRCLRWLCWIATAGYFFEFYLHRRDHLNSFGQLLPTTEFWMFALPLAGVFVGFLELMARERTGFDRPALLRNWLGLKRDESKRNRLRSSPPKRAKRITR